MSKPQKFDLPPLEQLLKNPSFIAVCEIARKAPITPRSLLQTGQFRKVFPELGASDQQLAFKLTVEKLAETPGFDIRTATANNFLPYAVRYLVVPAPISSSPPPDDEDEVDEEDEDETTDEPGKHFDGEILKEEVKLPLAGVRFSSTLLTGNKYDRDDNEDAEDEDSHHPRKAAGAGRFYYHADLDDYMHDLIRRQPGRESKELAHTELEARLALADVFIELRDRLLVSRGGERKFGDKWETVLTYGDVTPHVVINDFRLRPAKLARPTAVERFATMFEPAEGARVALYLDASNVTKHPDARKELFSELREYCKEDIKDLLVIR